MFGAEPRGEIHVDEIHEMNHRSRQSECITEDLTAEAILILEVTVFVFRRQLTEVLAGFLEGLMKSSTVSRRSGR